LVAAFPRNASKRIYYLELLMTLLEISQDSVKQCPKILLHDHLDGGLRPETIISLAQESGYTQLPSSNAGELSRWMLNTAKQGNLELYLEAFAHTVGVMQTRESLNRVAKECVEDLDDDGVIYAEVRFAPELFQETGLSLSAVVSSVLDGFKSGMEGREIVAKAILCAMRSNTRSMEIVEIASDFLGKGVVGFDIAGPEIGHPPNLHLEAFTFAQNNGVPITIHAGEAAGPDYIEEALDPCGADRIGHGVSIAKEVNEEGNYFRKGSTASAIVENMIPLEICPTSNLHTGVVNSLSEHPVDMLLRAGFQVTVNTDNRLMSCTSMTNELWECHKAFGWGWEEISAVADTGIRNAFIPQAEKDPVMERLRSWYGTNPSYN